MKPIPVQALYHFFLSELHRLFLVPDEFPLEIQHGITKYGSVSLLKAGNVFLAFGYFWDKEVFAKEIGGSPSTESIRALHYYILDRFAETYGLKEYFIARPTTMTVAKYCERRWARQNILDTSFHTQQKQLLWKHHHLILRTGV